MKQVVWAIALLTALTWESAAAARGAPPSPYRGKPVALIGAGSEKNPAAYTVRDRVLVQESIAFEMHRWLDPAEYRKYAAILVSDSLQGGDIEAGRWYESEANAALVSYVRSGGVVVVEAGALHHLADRTQMKVLLPVFGHGRPPEGCQDMDRVRITAGRDAIAGDLPNGRFGWVARGTSAVADLTTAKAIARLERSEGAAAGPALATVNRIDRGKVYWFGTSLHRLYSDVARAGPGVADGDGVYHLNEAAGDAEAYRQLIVAAVREGGPAASATKAERWEPIPLGASVPGASPDAATDFPSDYRRTVAIREEPRRPEGAPVVLAEDGVARAAIVLPDDPAKAETRVAAALSEHLKAMSGAALPVVRLSALGTLGASPRGCDASDPRWSGKNLVLVGPHAVLGTLGAAPEALGPEGMVVKTVGNTVVVAGKDANGVGHACFTLLELLGCRYLWPGELGKVVPKKGTVSVPPTDIAEAPRLWQRYIRSVRPHSERYQKGVPSLGLAVDEYAARYREATATDQTDNGWWSWHRMGAHRKIHRGHSFGGYWTAYGETHPEWFALQPNGSRDQSRASRRPRLCLSNRELIDRVIRNKIEELEKHPEQEGVGIGLNDGSYTTFCLCENCRRLDPANGRQTRLTDFTAGRGQIPYVSLSDRVLWFANQIAAGLEKRFPDKHLGYYAYSLYKTPPLRIRPHRNLIVFFVDGHYQNETSRMRALNDWRKWTGFGNRMFYRPNVLYANRYVALPQNFARKIFHDFKYLYNHDLIGTDFDSCEQHWAIKGLVYYCLAKAHWNPNRLDYDEIVADWCRSGFAEAAPPVAEYLALLENITDRAAIQGGGIIDQYTKKDFQGLRDCLARARERAAGLEDAKIARRVEFLQRGLDIGELQWKYNRATRDRQRAKHALLELLARTAHEHTMAVNAPYIATNVR